MDWADWMLLGLVVVSVISLLNYVLVGKNGQSRF